MAKNEDVPQAPKPHEGPRGFAVMLQQVHDGELHGELSAELQKLVALLGEHSTKFQRPAKGAISLTLNITAVGHTVEVVGDVKVKAPKTPRPRSVFWRTDGGNLSVENPRQTKLPLREVPPGPTVMRELAPEAAAPRSI